MRQVPEVLENSSIPTRLLLIGSGRVATHLEAYFSSENLVFKKWSRKSPVAELSPLLEEATHVLLAVSDRAIANFYSDHRLQLAAKICVHFSGANLVEGVWAAHPLMSFAGPAYAREVYRSIPFVLQEGSPPFAQLIPGLTNEFFRVPNKQRGLYHALCSMGGNFSVLLWEFIFREFANKLDLKPEILLPYMRMTTERLAGEASTWPNSGSVLTGPLVRGDAETIEKHINALGKSPMGAVYKAFVESYQKTERDRLAENEAETV